MRGGYAIIGPIPIPRGMAARDQSRPTPPTASCADKLGQRIMIDVGAGGVSDAIRQIRDIALNGMAAGALQLESMAGAGHGTML